MPASCASSIARLVGAEIAATTGIPASQAFCTISNDTRPLTMRTAEPPGVLREQQGADGFVDGVVAADVFGGREERAVDGEHRRAVQAARFLERGLARAQPVGQLADQRPTSTDHVASSGAMSARSSSIVARPQTPHELLAMTCRRLSSSAGTRVAASPCRNTSMTWCALVSSGCRQCSMAPMSSADRMMRSERRNPAASARSSPGVRMMTANDRPCSRTSSGSSAAAASVVRLTPSGPDADDRDQARGRERPLAAIVGHRALEKRLADRRVRETDFVFHGQIGKTLSKGRREESHARRGHGTRFVVDADAVQSAARRLRLQHVAGEIRPGELAHPPPRVLPHGAGVVDPGLDRDHARVSTDGHEPDRLARHAETELDLRAHAHPLHVRIERLHQEGVALVAAVEPHLVAEQAGRDADPEPLHPRSAIVMISTRAPAAARATFTGVIDVFAPNAARHSAIAPFAASSSVT